MQVKEDSMMPFEPTYAFSLLDTIIKTPVACIEYQTHQSRTFADLLYESLHEGHSPESTKSSEDIE